MHEIRIAARKFEKESEEAKKEAESARKEAKLWKEKYNEVEQYKEKLIRPVPNKMSAYMQPIINPNLNGSMNHDSSDVSPQSKSIHESSVERERPPSTSSNSAGYVPPPSMYAPQATIPNQALPTGMSPTPMAHPAMFMRGMPPPMYRTPFPGPPPFLPGLTRPTAPSPDIMAQYMSRLPSVIPPMMPPGASYPSPQQPLRQTPLSFNSPPSQVSPGQPQYPYNNNNNNGK